MRKKKKSKKHSCLAYCALIFAIGIILYMVILPFAPRVHYSLSTQRHQRLPEKQNVPAQQQTIEALAKQAFIDTPGENRIFIPKIGVNSPVVEDENEQRGLSRGAWRVPRSSNPARGGNTVITGHRFQYLPPNNLTFYLLDKLEPKDTIGILWDNELYYYEVQKQFIVKANELSIMNATEDPVLTLFTCDPIFSTKNRLVVQSVLVTKTPVHAIIVRIGI